MKRVTPQQGHSFHLSGENDLHRKDMIRTGDFHHPVVLLDRPADIPDAVSVQFLVILAGKVAAALHQRLAVHIICAAVGCPD